VIAADLRSMARTRMPGLDGLRGIAILLVLLHGFDALNVSGGLWHGVDLTLDAGWVGVQLFFVLSGFLITGILLDTQHSPAYYRNFFVRRVLRIFPLYYGVLFIAFVVAPLLLALPAGYGGQQIWLWTYTENFAAPFGGSNPLFPHFWSLCVEEQFYLVWPLVVRVAGRRGVIALGSALVVIAIASRIYVRMHFGQPVGAEAAYSFTPCRFDALAIGAVTAALLRGERVGTQVIHRTGARLLAVAGTFVVLLGLVVGRLGRLGEPMQFTGYTIIAFGFAVVLVGAMAPTSRFFAWAPLRTIGTYSYAMYVFYAPLHLLVGLPLLARIGAAPSIAWALAYVAAASLATFCLAALSYHFYERYFLALKPRLAPLAG
jgi:peptidoglycan/LPS O-acetylase OafA/YrhL